MNGGKTHNKQKNNRRSEGVAGAEEDTGAVIRVAQVTVLVTDPHQQHVVFTESLVTFELKPKLDVNGAGLRLMLTFRER